MTPQGIARRYATALFDVAKRSGRLDAVGRDLETFRAFTAEHPDLCRVFASPTVPARNKHALIDVLLARAPGLSGEVGRLLQMLADQDRLMLLEAMAGAFNEHVMRANKIMAAVIVTAVPLPDGRAASLGAALGRATGHTITVTERVDPSIIGGLIAKVGSTVYDGSITRQIEKMRGALVAQR